LETLKIALIDLYGRFGGGQVSLSNMAHALSKKGHEVHILLGVKNIPRRVTELCSPNCYLHQTLGYSNLKDITKIFSKTRTYILKIHKSYEFDVISAQGITGLFVPPTLQDRLIVTLHGNNMQRGLMLFKFACEKSEMRSAVLRHSRNFFRDIIGHFLYGKLEKEVCEKAKIVIVLTPTEAYYARKWYSISSQKIRVVPNVVVDLKDDCSKEIRISPQQKVILSVGALEFIKGIPILTKAIGHVLASTKDVTYVSVGNGPLMSNVVELKIKFPDKVIILPQIASGLSSLYSRSLVLVHGSLYEAMSLSMAEAMLSGKPVVAFRLASIPDLIVDNVTGLLAKPVDSKDLANKTLSLIENGKEAVRIGVNAKNVVDKLYNEQIIGNSLERVLRDV